MPPLERKIALMRKGVSMADIGRELGVSGTHVSLVVAGKRRSARVEAAVATRLEASAEEIFGPPESPQPDHVAAA